MLEPYWSWPLTFGAALLFTSEQLRPSIISKPVSSLWLLESWKKTFNFFTLLILFVQPLIIKTDFDLTNCCERYHPCCWSWSRADRNVSCRLIRTSSPEDIITSTQATNKVPLKRCRPAQAGWRNESLYEHRLRREPSVHPLQLMASEASGDPQPLRSQLIVLCWRQRQ